jgi:putative ABC transport system permease protein
VAVLRTIGASPRQLMTLFQSEAAVMGFAGSILGLLLGIWLAHLALSAVSKTVSSLYVEVHARQLEIPLWLYFAVPLGVTLMAWGASWFSAREANSVSPRMAFSNSSLHQNTQNNAWPFAGIGTLLLCFGGVLCLPRISHISPLIGFVAAFFTLSGFAFLCPLVTLFYSIIAQKICVLAGNPAPRLASMNLRLTLHRTSLVVAALAVALSLVVGLEVMVYSFRHSVAVWVDQSLTGDLYISTARGFSGDPGPGLPPEVLRKIQQQPGIEALDTLRGSHIHLQNQPVFIAARSLNAVFAGRNEVPFKSTFRGTQTALQNYRDGKVLFLSERFSNLLKKKAGETLQLPTPQGKKYFFIAAVFYDYTPDAAVLYMPQSLYKNTGRRKTRALWGCF